MLCGFADYSHHAFSANDFAFVTDRFYRGADFHIFCGETYGFSTLSRRSAAPPFPDYARSWNPRDPLLALCMYYLFLEGEGVDW